MTFKTILVVLIASSAALGSIAARADATFSAGNFEKDSKLFDGYAWAVDGTKGVVVYGIVGGSDATQSIDFRAYHQNSQDVQYYYTYYDSWDTSSCMAGVGLLLTGNTAVGTPLTSAAPAFGGKAAIANAAAAGKYLCSTAKIASAVFNSTGSFLYSGLQKLNTAEIKLNCSAGTITWGSGNICSASISAKNDGISTYLTNQYGGATGSANALCSNGSWVVNSPSCSANLAAPSAVIATDGALPGNIAITWAAVPYASGYDIQYRKQGTPTWTTVAGVSSGWQLPTTDESTFEFQVVAKNAAGQGAWSATDTGYIARSCATQAVNWGSGNYCSASATGTTSSGSRPLTNGTAGASGTATALCTNGTWSINPGSSCNASMVAPAALSATDGTLQGKIAVTWGAIAGADGYNVQYRKQGTGTWTAVNNVTSGWQFDTSDRATLEFQVQGKNALGVGAWSATDTGFIAQTCQPATLKWGTSNFCSAAVGLGDPGSSLNLSNASAGAAGTAEAKCDAITGNWSLANPSCSVSLASPSTFTATQGTIADNIKASWSGMDGAAGYDVQYRQIGTPDWTQAPGVSTGWTLPVADVNNYEFQLRARNVLGASDWSTSATGWIQRCDATPLSWGVASLCSATPAVTKTGGSLDLASATMGASGGTTAACVAGKWALSASSCVVAMNLDATDGTLEDEVALAWTSSIASMSNVRYDLYRGEQKIATNIKALAASDVPDVRGVEQAYKVQAILNNEVVGEAQDTGYLPACRAARLVGASLNADMTAISGLIEQWACLDDLNATSAIDMQAKQGMSIEGEKTYKSFSVVVPTSLPDGSHVLHLGLQSAGVVLNADRVYDVPFTLDRASIAVKNMSIIYSGSNATNGMEANSIGRFGIKMDGGSGIGFAEELK